MKEREAHTCLKCGAREELKEIGFHHYRYVDHGIDGSWNVPVWKCKVCGYEDDWGYLEWPLKPELTALEIMHRAMD